jgi:DNA-binding transcriptional ArsR family regulator
MPPGQRTRRWHAGGRQSVTFGTCDISPPTDTFSTEMTARLPVVPAPRAGLIAPNVRAATEAAALLADPTRAAILALLRDGPHCVCEMAAATGERENNVSNHLARLRRAGLVRASRHQADARWVYYERDEQACATARAALQQILG